MNIIVAAIILISGFAGAWFHWRQVNKRGDCDGFFNYFFTNNVNGTAAAGCAFVATMETLYVTGTFDTVDIAATMAALRNGVIYAPMAHLIVTSFSAGYMCDSKLNSVANKQVLPSQPAKEQ